MGDTQREREREREKHTHVQRGREGEKHTHTRRDGSLQTHRWREREKHAHTNKQRAREKERGRQCPVVPTLTENHTAYGQRAFRLASLGNTVTHALAHLYIFPLHCLTCKYATHTHTHTHTHIKK